MGLSLILKNGGTGKHMQTDSEKYEPEDMSENMYRQIVSEIRRDIRHLSRSMEDLRLELASHNADERAREIKTKELDARLAALEERKIEYEMMLRDWKVSQSDKRHTEQEVKSNAIQTFFKFLPWVIVALVTLYGRPS